MSKRVWARDEQVPRPVEPVERARDWLESKLVPDPEEGMALAAFAGRKKLLAGNEDRVGAIVDEITDGLYEVVNRYTWSYRDPWCGSKRREFLMGEGREFDRLTSHSLLNDILRQHNVGPEHVGWPSGAVLQVNPSFVRVRFPTADRDSEVVYRR